VAEEKVNMMRLPWLTVTLVLSALVVYCFSSLSQGLIFDRTLVLEGQWWRVPTSLLVHYSASHLFWNMAPFFVLGTILEQENRRAFIWLLILVSISNGLFLFNPNIDLFAGASGLVIAIAGYCCIVKMVNGESRFLWGLLFAVLVAKIGYEMMSGEELFASGNFHVLPEAHLLGLVSAIVLFLIQAGTVPFGVSKVMMSKR